MDVFVHLMTGIANVEFVGLMGFLVFLCFRTRSKGLIWVTAALPLMEVKALNYIVGVVCYIFNIGAWEPGIGAWEPGLDVRGAALTLRLEISIIISGIEIVLGYGLCLLGAFLIYKEWRQGKFRHLEPKPLQER